MLETDGTVSPVPTYASKATISEFAEKLASSLQFGAGDALEPVVARFGGQIIYHNPSLHTGRPPESIRVFSDRRFEIYIPSTTSVERDRFTIAHELGHYFLHYPMALRNHPDAVMVATRWVNETDAPQRRAEWEANWFAASFLMPSMEFRSQFDRLNKDLAAIANYFRVSTSAAQVRVSNLALI